MARIQKKEGFIRTPPSRYGPSSSLSQFCCIFLGKIPKLDTEYDRAKVPPYNGNDPPPGSLKAPLFPPLLTKVQDKGTQRVRTRYDAELPPFIAIVRQAGRPVILGMEKLQNSEFSKFLQSGPQKFTRSDFSGKMELRSCPSMYCS